MSPANHRRVPIAVAVAILIAVSAAAWMWTLRTSSKSKTSVKRLSGTLLIAGGGVLPKSIRERFIELAGGSKARVVVVPGHEPDEAGLARQRGFWSDFNVESLTILSANSAQEANSETFLESLRSATGVWLGGGTQVFLAERYVDTQAERELFLLLGRGGVVGGTSAGASIMTRTMIVDGRHDAVLGRGLGLLPDAVIDQHFLKRNRLARLLGVLRQHPDLIGFGIDERTALEFHVLNHSLSVVGDSYVMAVVAGSHDRPPRLEILKPTDQITLEGLRDPKVPVAQSYDFEEYLSD